MANVTNVIIKEFDDLKIAVKPFDDVRVIVPVDEEEQQGIFDFTFGREFE